MQYLIGWIVPQEVKRAKSALEELSKNLITINISKPTIPAN